MSYPPPAPPFLAARYHGGSQTPKAIVIHGTVSHDDKGTARQIAEWWHGPTSPETSAHYIVDPTQIWQTVGDHTVAYHCGYNTGTIAIELCDEEVGAASRWQDADSKAILLHGAHLAAELCLAYDLDPHRPSVASLKAKGPHGIYGHNDSRLAFGHTTHTDPRDFPWRQFMDLTQGAYADLKSPGVKTPRWDDLWEITNKTLQLANALQQDAPDVSPRFVALAQVKRDETVARNLAAKWSQAH